MAGGVKRRIALLTAYPLHIPPSLRFRIGQYLPALQEAGYTIECIPFFSAQQYQTFTARDTPILRRFGIIGSSFLGSLVRAINRGRWDGIYLHREATVLGTTLVEKLWMRGLPVIVDFDDAIWIVNVSEENKRFAWLKSSQKLPRLLRQAKVVTVCNEYLAAFARQYAEDVRIIPTTIDTDLYRALETPPKSYVVIGWSGSRTTTAHLRTIEGALVQLYKLYGDRIRFRFIGTSGYQPPFPAEILPWRADTEVEDLMKIDIGLMPLPDEDWSRGKCALKALQYMALGKAAVVSPIGMNCEVIEDGVNGLFARTLDDWVDKISYLIEHPEVRQSLGRAAREVVERQYSVRANTAKYMEAFEAAFK
ncbi:MAG: glycosyltransferase family 4 protein [Bacteroidia bacterium]|nr:glycosyltransferase family 4 protein [Bacteroidia bacterium]